MFGWVIVIGIVLGLAGAVCFLCRKGTWDEEHLRPSSMGG